jgi:hypothetical protein
MHFNRPTIPEGRAVDGGLNTLGLAGVRRVLVGRRDREVLRGRTRTVDVPLPRGDLVRPRP